MNIKNTFLHLSTNALARSSLIVLTGTMTANVLSYLYHLLMGRLLGPAGYGELSSLLSLLYITTVPLLVAQTVLVKFVSGFKASGDISQAKSLFLLATKYFVICILVLLPFIIFVEPVVRSYLHLTSPGLILILYILLAVSLLSIAPSAILTGYQKFIWVSAMGAFVILIKVIVSIPFAVWGVPGVMIAALISALITYVLYYFPLRFLLNIKAKPTTLKTRELLLFAVPTLFTQLGITSLYSTDIILARHYLDGYASGVYAAIAILGKIIFFATSAVPVVLFPIASERFAKGDATRKLIVSAVVAVAITSILLTIIYFLFPQFIVRLLFGNAYADAGKYLGMFGIFISLFSVANILALASLAVGKTGVWIISAISALTQIIGISLYHATITEILSVNIGVSAVFAISTIFYYATSTHKKI